MGFFVIEFFLDSCFFMYCCRFCKSVVLVWDDDLGDIVVEGLCLELFWIFFEFVILIVLLFLEMGEFFVKEENCEIWFFKKFWKDVSFVVLLLDCKDLINEFLWESCFCK